jgi:hypothetical protein
MLQDMVQHGHMERFRFERKISIRSHPEVHSYASSKLQNPFSIIALKMPGITQVVEAYAIEPHQRKDSGFVRRTASKIENPLTRPQVATHRLRDIDLAKVGMTQITLPERKPLRDKFYCL